MDMKELFEGMQREGFIPADRMYHLLSTHERNAFNKVTEGCLPIRELEEQVHALEQEVGDLQEEVRDLERKLGE